MKELRLGEIKSVTQSHWATIQNPDCLPSSSLTNILENALLTTKQAFTTVNLQYNNNISIMVRMMVKENSILIFHALVQ